MVIAEVNGFVKTSKQLSGPAAALAGGAARLDAQRAVLRESAIGALEHSIYCSATAGNHGRRCPRC